MVSGAGLAAALAAAALAAGLAAWFWRPAWPSACAPALALFLASCLGMWGSFRRSAAVTWRAAFSRADLSMYHSQNGADPATARRLLSTRAGA